MRRSARRKSSLCWGRFPSWEPSSGAETTEWRRPSSFSSSPRRSSPAGNPSARPVLNCESKKGRKKNRIKKRPMRSEEGMTEGEMPDEGMLDVGMTDERIRKPKPRKIRAAVVIGALALGLLGGGGMIAYFTHTNLDLTIQGLETAYTAEQTAAKKLVRRAQELSKTSAQAQARAKALEERQKASEAERGNLEVRNKKLATAYQGLQTANAAEQASTRRLGQTAEELSKALQEAQARVKALEVSQKAVEQQKSELEARSAKLETTVQGLQTAYAAEQDTAKKLTEKAEELSKALEQAQARRVKAREEKPADLPGLNYALGMSYSKRGMKEEARNAFQTALKFDPNYAEAHFELARLYLVSFDDNRSATRHFRQYLALKPTAEDAERVKGWLMKTEKELNADKQRQGWGKMGLVGGLRRIFE